MLLEMFHSVLVRSPCDALRSRMCRHQSAAAMLIASGAAAVTLWKLFWCKYWQVSVSAVRSRSFASDPASHVALLVGIGAYHNFPQLSCTKSDVYIVRKALERHHFSVREQLDCTLREFDRAVSELASDIRKQSCEVLLVYFAGHAVEREGRNALLCIDSDPRYSDEEHTLDQIMARLIKVLGHEAKMVVVLDCCREPTLQPMPTVVRFPRHGQFYVLFACGAGQAAKESALIGNGIFTREFVKFLDNQANFNITPESFSYYADAVAKRTHGFQRPEILCRAFKPWKCQIWNVQRRNKNFVGRSKLLDDLEERLRIPGVVCLIAACGLAGVGKTQLVVEMLHTRCMKKHIVWWLNAEHEVVLQRGLAELAVKVGVVSCVEVQSDLTSAAQKAIHALEEELQSWVLIFDNAPTYDHISSWLPARGGVILITSRSPHWDDTLAVPMFDPSESLELLRKIVSNDEAFDGAAEVADKLGHHPLALAMGGGWVRETNLSLRRYSRLLSERDERSQILGSLPEAVKQQSYNAPITATVALAIQALKVPSAVIMCRLCAMLAPEQIPYNVLRKFYCQWSGPDATDADLAKIIKELCDHSLIAASGQDYTCELYCMHRLVQMVCLDALFSQDLQAEVHNILQQASLVMVLLFHFDLVKNVHAAKGAMSEQYASLAPHFHKLVDFGHDFRAHYVACRINASFDTLQLCLAEYAYEVDKDEHRALHLVDRCLSQGADLNQSLTFRSHLLRTRILHSSASNELLIAELKDALAFEDVESIDADELIEAHVILACLYTYIGSSFDAKEHVRVGLALVAKHGRDSIPTLVHANVQEGISVFESVFGDQCRALEASQKMYNIRCELLGETSLLVLHALRGLAMDCTDIDPEQAVRYASKLVELTEQVMGSSHHDTSFAQRVLAQSLYEVGNLEDAERVCLVAHSNTAQGSYWHGILSDLLGAIKIDVGRSRPRSAMEAIKLHQEGLTAFESIDGKLTMRRIPVLARSAIAHAHADECDEAKRIAEEALQLCLSISEAPLMNLHLVYISLAEAHLKEDSKAAEQFYADALNHGRQWPEEHPLRLRVERHLSRSRQRNDMILNRSALVHLPPSLLFLPSLSQITRHISPIAKLSTVQT